MELYEAMSTLRAVRRLRPDPIPEDVLERVLTAATWAPTGGNHQGWRIVAVTDADKKQALEDLYRPHWENYVPGYEQHLANMPEGARQKSERALAAGTYLATHMHEVPVVAVFCFKPSTDDHHRCRSRSAQRGWRRLSLPGSTEPAAGSKKRRAWLCSDNLAVYRGSGGETAAGDTR